VLVSIAVRNFRAISAILVLSHIAWCAELVEFLAVIGVEDGNGSCVGHMGMGNLTGIASSLQCMISWAMDIRQAELHIATVQTAYV
jgi:hypothetical protein